MEDCLITEDEDKEDKNKKREGRYCLDPRPSVIDNLAIQPPQRARKTIPKGGARQLFKNPFYDITGLLCCQENFGQIKIILILPNAHNPPFKSKWKLL
jgi:hypothetical protein